MVLAGGLAKREREITGKSRSSPHTQKSSICFAKTWMFEAWQAAAHGRPAVAFWLKQLTMLHFCVGAPLSSGSVMDDNFLSVSLLQQSTTLMLLKKDPWFIFTLFDMIFVVLHC